VVDGHYLNLGGFEDFAYLHQKDKELYLDFSFRLPEPLELDIPFLYRKRGEVNHRRIRIEEVRIETQFAYHRTRKMLYAKHSVWSILPDNVSFERTWLGGKTYKITFNPGNLGDLYQVTNRATGEFKCYNLSSFVSATFRPSIASKRTISKLPFLQWITYGRLADEITSETENLFSRLFYIGPLRESPRRVYVATGETPQDVGLRGESSVEVLWNAGEPGEARRALLDKVNHWMNNFGIAKEVRFQKLAEKYFSLIVVDPKLDIEVNIADIGFGASQVLPIIVEGFYAPRHSTLIMEQPEIHLHPALQAALGDLFIEISREQKTLLVETHSEHLLTRIQRRVAEGILDKSNVAIYYFEATHAGCLIREIRLNDLGQFEAEGLPEDFFAERYKESLAHAKAIASKINPG